MPKKIYRIDPWSGFTSVEVKNCRKTMYKPLFALISNAKSIAKPVSLNFEKYIFLKSPREGNSFKKG